MSAKPTIEQRLEALERAVAEIQNQLVKPAPASNWVEEISGRFKDDPGYEEMLRYGREFRHADRPCDDAPSDP